MSNSLSGWNERFEQAADYQGGYDYYGNEIISDRRYNLTLGASVLYGLLVNALLCGTVGADLYYSVPPILFLIGYFICCFAGTMIAHRSSNPAVSFLGYNLIVVPIGLVVSSVVEAYGGISSRIVVTAFYYTILITAIMILASVVYPSLFENLGGVLFTCLIGLLICGLVMFFIPALDGIYAYGGAAIFSLYIGYDYLRAQRCIKTTDNAIDCAMDIYLDIINLFLYILRILSSKGNNGRRSR